MRKRIAWLLVVLNVVLSGGLWALGSFGTDCCQETSGGSRYCCDGCCTFVANCDDDADCKPN